MNREHTEVTGETMTKETFSQEAVVLDHCSFCLKKLPPLKAFSRVCVECRKKIESGEIFNLVGGKR